MTNTTRRVKTRYTEYARGLADGIGATISGAALIVLVWWFLTLVAESVVI